MFRDRTDAGRQLGERLRELELELPIVLGLPRGGVVVAAQVAAAIGCPFDVFISRKVGSPGHQELGIGAVAEGMDRPVVSDVAAHVGVKPADLEALVESTRAEVSRRVGLYRQGRPLPDLTGRSVVLVDDGLATGVTAEAALVSLRQFGPARLVLAVPVCATGPADGLARVADQVVCLARPAEFFAVGQWYEDFTQTTDDEVVALLARAGA